MIRQRVTILVLLCSVILALGGDESGTTREQRELKMADESIRASLAVSRSPKGRYLCSESRIACLGADKAELGLALVGARSTKASLAALADLARYRMDASLAEDYGCYILQKSGLIENYLVTAKPSLLEERCNSELEKLVSTDKQSLEGLKSSAVCADERSIRTKIKELVDAIHQGRKCASEDF
jgi:Immunity protein 57